VGAQAENPKAKARQKVEVDASQKEAYLAIPDNKRCLRFGQLRECSHSHRCADCWFDSGLSPVHVQAKVILPPPDWIPMELFVEDGISMLACLIHQRYMAKEATSFPGRHLTARAGHNPPPDFSNHVFQMRQGTQRRGSENFYVEAYDFKARWNEHIGYGGFQNRQVKGKEWIRIMELCLKSLGGAR
jgi:hypothetical protein